MFMSITTIVLVALLMAILIMETALILWMHKTQAKSVEKGIVNALNIEGVNISSYVDMVLTDHLMRYESQIDHLLHNCYGKSRKLAN